MSRRGRLYKVIASRREHAAQAELPSSIVLDEAQAQRFLDSRDAPAGFEPGLRRLAGQPRVLGG
jgi:uncharacterized protein (DUF1778 family)